MIYTVVTLVVAVGVQADMPTVPPAPPTPLARPIRPEQWIRAKDYPARAMRNGDGGRVGFTLHVGRDGHVTDCRIEESSGSEALDEATCRILSRRARFARMASPGIYRRHIAWVLRDRRR